MVRGPRLLESQRGGCSLGDPVRAREHGWSRSRYASRPRCSGRLGAACARGRSRRSPRCCSAPWSRREPWSPRASSWADTCRRAAGAGSAGGGCLRRLGARGMARIVPRKRTRGKPCRGRRRRARAHQGGPPWRRRHGGPLSPRRARRQPRRPGGRRHLGRPRLRCRLPKPTRRQRPVRTRHGRGAARRLGLPELAPFRPRPHRRRPRRPPPRCLPPRRPPPRHRRPPRPRRRAAPRRLRRLRRLLRLLRLLRPRPRSRPPIST